MGKHSLESEIKREDKMKHRVEISTSLEETTTWTDDAEFITYIVNYYLDRIGHFEDGFMVVSFVDPFGGDDWIHVGYSYDRLKYTVNASDGVSEETQSLAEIKEVLSYWIHGFISER